MILAWIFNKVWTFWQYLLSNDKLWYTYYNIISLYLQHTYYEYTFKFSRCICINTCCVAIMYLCITITTVQWKEFFLCLIISRLWDFKRYSNTIYIHITRGSWIKWWYVDTWSMLYWRTRKEPIKGGYIGEVYPSFAPEQCYSRWRKKVSKYV